MDGAVARSIKHAERVLDDVAKRAAALSGPALRRAIDQAVVEFTRDMRWELQIAGEHYSGLSNQALLEVREREGRPFAQHTVQLKQHVRKELRWRYRDYHRVPTRDELRETAGDLILLFIVQERIEGRGGDIHLEPLTAKYAAWKRRQGKGGRPIGVLEGKWVKAVRRRGRIVWH